MSAKKVRSLELTEMGPEVLEARGMITAAYDSLSKTRPAAAKLLGVLHERLFDAPVEVRARVFEHLGTMLAEVDSVEFHLDQLHDHVSKEYRR